MHPLLKKIAEGSIHVGVIGMGHVGVPIAMNFVSRAQIRTTGFDIDHYKIDCLKRRHCYIRHLDGELVRGAMASPLFDATSDFQRLAEPDALLITVPTPLTAQREPDMTYVVDTVKQIAQCLRSDQLVVLESTSYPGATEGLVREILEQSGLRCGKDFLLAFSPEREDPGNRQFCTSTIPKVVGGVDALSTEVAATLYAQAVEVVVRVPSARVAEATKLTENIFRAVNIALVNELKMIFDKMGIDIWEVLEAASTKPFGFMRFDPGPGLGGHCIPLDPFYLTWKAREFGVSTRFIELAGEINVSMPEYVIEKLRDALNDRGKPLNGCRILVLGIAYKKDIDDTRESASLALIDALLRHKSTVCYHDPHIPVAPAVRSWPQLPPMQSIELSPQTLRSFDAVILATAHSAIDYDSVLENARLIVDVRGVYRTHYAHVVKA